jgi:hypothetical protein
MVRTSRYTPRTRKTLLGARNAKKASEGEHTFDKGSHVRFADGGCGYVLGVDPKGRYLVENDYTHDVSPVSACALELDPL